MTTAIFLLFTLLLISGFRGNLSYKKGQSEADMYNYMHWATENRDELVYDKDFCPYLTPRFCKKNKYRNLDGQCNNLNHPFWGSSNTPFMRFVPPAYDDGKSSSREEGVNGEILMNPAFIRNRLFSSNTNFSLTRNINIFKVFFSQFVTHDITKTAGLLASPTPSDYPCCEKSNLSNFYCVPIRIPPKLRMGQRHNCYSFFRSLPAKRFNCDYGPREQKNLQTSFLDLSHVYGTSEYGSNYLRLKKKGMIKMVKCGDDFLLPPDWDGITGCQNTEYPCMLAGDLRLNQHPILTYLHIIWALEHNRVAEKLYQLNPKWEDERLFQEASKIVRAEYQHIVYNELLPIIIGYKAMEKYGLISEKMGYYFGYKKDANAGVRNGFTTAAYRYAHSMIDDSVTFEGGCPYASKKCTSKDIGKIQHESFRPSVRHGCTRKIHRNLSQVTTADLYQHMTGGTELLRGMLRKRAQLSNDLRFSEDLSLRMFPGQIELLTFDIQRGRDHGLPGYNVWRKFCNLSTAKSFRKRPGGLVDHPKAIARKLARIYKSPDDIDLLLGGLTESSQAGSGIVGPLFKCIIGSQFKLLKQGDRFWYENHGLEGFSLAQLNEIRKTSISRILLDNSHLQKVPKDAFRIFNMFLNPMVNTENIPKIDMRFWDE